MAESDLTAARLRELVSYDPLTGQFTRLVGGCGKNNKPGAVAGHPDGQGYLRFRVAGHSHKAHRLAVLHVTGQWPSSQVDHRNGVRSDSRWENLRVVSPRLNNENSRSARPFNLSGLLGVSTKHRKFVAIIQVHGIQRTIGRFDTAEEAHSAYLQAKRTLHAGCTI